MIWTVVLHGGVPAGQHSVCQGQHAHDLYRGLCASAFLCIDLRPALQGQDVDDGGRAMARPWSRKVDASGQAVRGEDE